MNKNESRARDILAELVADVEAVGVDVAKELWPDVVVTYQKAKAFTGNPTTGDCPLPRTTAKPLQ